MLDIVLYQPEIPPNTGNIIRLVVDNKRQQRVVANMPDAEYILVEAARHEILIETDTIRQPVMKRIFDFFSREF